MSRRNHFHVLRATSVLIVLACNDSPQTLTPPNPPAAFVITTENNQRLEVPRTLQITWRGGRDADSLSWQSSDQAIASVSVSGVVSANFPGTTTITARRGDASATLTVIATAARVEISPSLTVLELNRLQQMTAIVRDGNGAILRGVPVTWSTDNARVVRIDGETGLATPVAKGATTIRAVGGGASGIASVHVDPQGESLRFSSIGSITNHTCGLEATTDLAYCWGDNHAGALGIGDQEGSDLPMLVGGARRFRSLTVGDYATCGIEVSTAHAYCWGFNRFGDLGDNTFTTRWVPTIVSHGVIQFSRISASGTHTCGIEAKTSLGYCWGQGGLIGDGTRSPQPMPTLVHLAPHSIFFTDISAGASHSCGLEPGGAANCWGNNASGQLGDGTAIDRLVPTQVEGEALRFTAISAGWSLTCGIEAVTAMAYCWGSNKYGQVGDGTTINRFAPSLVGNGRQRFSSISATGPANACGIEALTAFVLCWGHAVGQLSDSSKTFRTEPTPLSGAARRFSSIVAAYYGGCGVEVDTGLGYCWTYVDMIPVPILPAMTSGSLHD